MIGLIALSAPRASGQDAADAEPEALSERVPEELKGIGIEEKLGEQAPLDLTFANEDGEQVALGEFFDGEQPVILTPVYFQCPMLCSLTLNGTVRAMKKLDDTPGEGFRVVVLSFDPRETHTLAAMKKKSYLRDYGRPQGARGWHFLTGEQANIAAVCDAVGFGYRWDEESRQYVHAAGIILLTPDGQVSDYLYGVEYEEDALRRAIENAAAGEIGAEAASEPLLLACFKYLAGSNTPTVLAVMRVGGAFTVLVIGVGLGGFWVREIARRRQSPADEAS